MVAMDSVKWKVDLVGVQVRWEKRGIEWSEDYRYTFLYGEGNEDLQLGTGF
jgi:hypothetical protein